MWRSPRARCSTPRTVTKPSPGRSSADASSASPRTVAGMEESVATEVVDMLRARHIFAHINRRVGVYSVGVRVVIPDGREAIWDNDGAAGLEAMVLRDGVLVGFVPQIPDSADLDAA